MSSRERAQSETVGVVLLIVVVVVLVTVAGGVVLSNLQAGADDGPRTAIGSSLTVSNLILEHEGGDSINASEVLVVLQGDSETRYQLAEDFTQVRGDDPTVFEPGDKWRRSSDGIRSVRLLVIDESTDTLLHDADREVRIDGLVFTVDGETGSSTITDEDTVSYAVSLSTNRGSEDVTDEASVEIVGGDSGALTIDESSNEIVGDAPGTATLRAEFEEFSWEIQVTVEAATPTSWRI
jgi:flagellin-like protein